MAKSGPVFCNLAIKPTTKTCFRVGELAFNVGEHWQTGCWRTNTLAKWYSKDPWEQNDWIPAQSPFFKLRGK